MESPVYVFKACKWGTLFWTALKIYRPNTIRNRGLWEEGGEGRVDVPSRWKEKGTLGHTLSGSQQPIQADSCENRTHRGNRTCERHKQQNKIVQARTRQRSKVDNLYYHQGRGYWHQVKEIVSWIVTNSIFLTLDQTSDQTKWATRMHKTSLMSVLKEATNYPSQPHTTLLAFDRTTLAHLRKENSSHKLDHNLGHISLWSLPFNNMPGKKSRGHQRVVCVKLNYRSLQDDPHFLP